MTPKEHFEINWPLASNDLLLLHCTVLFKIDSLIRYFFVPQFFYQFWQKYIKTFLQFFAILFIQKWWAENMFKTKILCLKYALWFSIENWALKNSVLKMAILQKKFSHSIFIRRKEISGSMNPQWKALSHKRAKISLESYMNYQNSNIPSRFFETIDTRQKILWN